MKSGVWMVVLSAVLGVASLGASDAAAGPRDGAALSFGEALGGTLGRLSGLGGAPAEPAEERERRLASIAAAALEKLEARASEGKAHLEKHRRVRRAGPVETDADPPSPPPFQGRYPVLLVPGLMGSQLEVRLDDRHDSPNWFCRRNAQEWSRMWMIDDWHAIVPELVACWEQDMVQVWNASTKSFQPAAEGILTRAKPDFKGATQLADNSPTLQPLADYMTQNFGYVQGKDVVAQPYDWRVGPETWMKEGGVFDRMKQLIEHTVDSRPGKEPIVAWSISLGGPFFSLFLSKHVDQQWKDRYIHSFFSVSGVMSGSVIAPYVALSGTRFEDEAETGVAAETGMPSYLKDALDRLAQSTSSVPWVFPHSDAFPPGEAPPIVQTPSRNYTAKDLGDALTAAGNSQQASLYAQNVDLLGLEALVPNVTTYCMTAYGVPTMASLVYGSDDFKGMPETPMTDGDNCVPVPSLRTCDAFGLHQKAPVFPYHVFNQTHAGLMYDAKSVTLFTDVFLGLQD